MPGGVSKARGSVPESSSPAPTFGRRPEDLMKSPSAGVRAAVEEVRKEDSPGTRKMDEILSAIGTLADRVGGIDEEEEEFYINGEGEYYD